MIHIQKRGKVSHADWYERMSARWWRLHKYTLGKSTGMYTHVRIKTGCKDGHRRSHTQTSTQTSEESVSGCMRVWSWAILMYCYIRIYGCMCLHSQLPGGAASLSSQSQSPNLDQLQFALGAVGHLSIGTGSMGFVSLPGDF